MKRTRKYEKRRKPQPDATPKTRVIRGSTFQFSSCMLGIIMIKLLSLLVNVSGHSWACLANIAILMQNAELCLGDYQGYHRFTAHKYQGTATLGVRHEKAKTISVILVTYLSLTGQCSSWSRLRKTLED